MSKAFSIGNYLNKFWTHTHIPWTWTIFFTISLQHNFSLTSFNWPLIGQTENRLSYIRNCIPVWHYLCTLLHRTVPRGLDECVKTHTSEDAKLEVSAVKLSPTHTWLSPVLNVLDYYVSVTYCTHTARSGLTPTCRNNLRRRFGSITLEVKQCNAKVSHFICTKRHLINHSLTVYELVRFR